MVFQMKISGLMILGGESCANYDYCLIIVLVAGLLKKKCTNGIQKKTEF